MHPQGVLLGGYCCGPIGVQYLFITLFLLSTVSFSLKVRDGLRFKSKLCHLQLCEVEVRLPL